MVAHPAPGFGIFYDRLRYVVYGNMTLLGRALKEHGPVAWMTH